MEQRGAGGDFRHVLILAVDELEITLHIRLDLFGGKQMDHIHVQLLRNKVPHGRFVAVFFHQV